jgi:glucosamine-6-phosphate deaminase
VGGDIFRRIYEILNLLEEFSMRKVVYETKAEMGASAGRTAIQEIAAALDRAPEASVILATGASQFETLDCLVSTTEVDWSRVTMFHLDEYIGLGESHRAGFRKYLTERFVDRVGALKAAHFVNGDAPDARAECRRLGELIRTNPVDVALVGIGENGHLAFNDPPADFDTEDPYLVVELDEACRAQQLGEGWFETIEDVPRRAISMSIRQIMKSRVILVSVPDDRKARAVADALEGPVSNTVPASILQQHPCCTIFMDAPAANLLTEYEKG